MKRALLFVFGAMRAVEQAFWGISEEYSGFLKD